MQNTENYQNVIREIVDNIEKVIIGKRDAIYLSLVALLSNGPLRSNGGGYDNGRW